MRSERDGRLSGLPHRLVVGGFVVALVGTAGAGWYLGTFDPSHFHLPTGFLLLCGWGTTRNSDPRGAGR